MFHNKIRPENSERICFFSQAADEGINCAEADGLPVRVRYQKRKTQPAQKAVCTGCVLCCLYQGSYMLLSPSNKSIPAEDVGASRMILIQPITSPQMICTHSSPFSVIGLVSIL